MRKPTLIQSLVAGAIATAILATVTRIFRTRKSASLSEA